MIQWIYLLEAQTGEIKIGCSNDPWGRLYTMVASSPCPIALIAKWPGSFKDEKALHAKYEAHRVYREWFKPEGELAVFSERVRGLNVEDAPEWFHEQSLPHDERKRLRSARLTRIAKDRWADPAYRERVAEFRSRRGLIKSGAA